jgi:hypothetical protein
MKLIVALLFAAALGLMFIYDSVQDSEAMEDCVARGGHAEQVNGWFGGWVCVGETP